MKLYNIIIIYSLRYLVINKQHKYQKDIDITKKNNISTTKIALKENKKI